MPSRVQQLELLPFLDTNACLAENGMQGSDNNLCVARYDSGSQTFRRLPSEFDMAAFLRDLFEAHDEQFAPHQSEG